uniref:4'-phosphopantetheine phosphatase n=1 Tax=Macrostomum lignano TaxID=282301 RepID=A0A1I8HC11_9PLAT
NTSEYCSSIAISELSADVLRDLPTAQRFALDIGGSLSKIVYQSKRKWRKTFVVYDENTDSHLYSTQELEKEADCLHFIKFETRLLENCLDFIYDNLKGSDGRGLEILRNSPLRVTGGGAHKYRLAIEAKLGCVVEKEDEMTCLVRGCAFMLKHIPGELFSYEHDSSPPCCFADELSDGGEPFLLVNIGSGVSMLKVENETTFTRIGGTSLGGGTFWGLGSLLAGTSDFDELLEIASQGDHRNVDMLVGDIYGSESASSVHGLSADIIASSFGKASKADCKEFSKPDLLRSLLITVSNNIGQLAFLYASRHQLRRIVFAGFFIRGHLLTMRTLTYGVNFWSQGSVKAYFLRHEGYLGAIGAFVRGLEKDRRIGVLTGSWAENLCTSSSFDVGSWQGMAALELDKRKELTDFPLLRDRLDYVPDTWDLSQAAFQSARLNPPPSQDLSAREYWLNCFEASIDRHQQRAVLSQPDSPSATERGEAFRLAYQNFFKEARANPVAFGQLTVRRILDVQEHCLRESGFPDPFWVLKREENEVALDGLQSRLSHLASLPSADLPAALIRGLLGGNVFDWGAGRVAELLAEHGKQFGLNEAMEQLQPRPWLVDDLDAWTSRLKAGVYTCAIVFVDNSGCDLLLGVLPFAIDLLDRGVKVILAANHGPALNDVTIFELRALIRRVGSFVPRVADALSSGRLLLAGTGSSSPCLDLRYVSVEVADACRQEQVDLVVIEGMGRAVHTNLYAKFSCDCLKLAVLKNAWLADRLGGNLFSVICSFEPAAAAAVG